MRPPIGGWDEVERGSLQLSFIRFKEIEYDGYSILDFLVVLVVIVSIPTAYCTGDEVYGLNTWALFWGCLQR